MTANEIKQANAEKLWTYRCEDCEGRGFYTIATWTNHKGFPESDAETCKRCKGTGTSLCLEWAPRACAELGYEGGGLAWDWLMDCEEPLVTWFDQKLTYVGTRADRDAFMAEVYGPPAESFEQAMGVALLGLAAKAREEGRDYHAGIHETMAASFAKAAEGEKK